MLCDIRVKNASDDLFQAAKTLLEKGCFAGAIIILSFTGFESTCKRQIRNLLIKRKNMSQKEADEYIEEKVRGTRKNGNITKVILKTFSELGCHELVDKIKKHQGWDVVSETIIYWRNDLVHTGYIAVAANASGKRKFTNPTIENAKISYEAASKIAKFIDNKFGCKPLID